MENTSLRTAAAFLLFAGAVLGQLVKTDYDRRAKFARYQTYSWQNVSTRDPLMVDRIKSDVNGALAANGWTEVPSGGDMQLVAIETARDQQTLKTFYDGFGGARRWYGLQNSVEKMFKHFPPETGK